jgi:uncharacterized protein (TIRG00374 family)
VNASDPDGTGRTTAGEAVEGLPIPAHLPGGQRGWTWSRVLRAVVVVAVFAGGTVVLVEKHQEVTGALHLLRHLRWGWVLGAAVVETLSLLPFARLQRWMFRAGGLTLGLWSTVWVTVAGNALGTSLPGGVAWSTAWMFGQYRRRGADRSLAAWALVTAGLLSGAVLFVLLVVGLWTAGGRGPLAFLRWPALGVVIGVLVALLVAATTVRRHPSGAGAPLASRLSATLHRWRWAATLVDDVVELASRLRPTLVRPTSWAQVVVMATANWLLDGACLVGCILAVRGVVPWQSILVVYATTQIAASMPISPGGLGVVEASLALLLVAYGTRGPVAIATVALYRLMSFWGLSGVGWLVWTVLSVGEGRTRRQLRQPGG